MNIQDVKDKLASLSDFTSFSDDPLLFILITGTIIVVFLLILLKLSFRSMQKADQKKLDEFINENEIPKL